MNKITNKEPKLPKNWGLIDGKPFTLGAPNPTNTKQIMLLAAAEESYSQAAGVLQPVILEVMDLLDALYQNGLGDPMVERLRAGLHLLEEAMKRHNAYMESLR